MAKSWLCVVAGMAFVLAGYACADAFSDGMSYGKGQQSTGTNAIKNFSPEEVIPGYTANPPETGYYGGVTSSGVDMTSPGMNELNTTGVGTAITDSILNTPADNKPSLDAPFISAGTSMQDNAENVVDPGFDECQEQNATFTEITTHQCNRTPAAELSCMRTASIKENASTIQERRTHTQTATLSNKAYTYTWDGTFTIPETGKLLRVDVASTTLPIPYISECSRTSSASNSDNACKNAVSESFSAMGVNLPVTVTAWPYFYRRCVGSNSSVCYDYKHDGVASVDGGFAQSLDVMAGQTFPLLKTSKKTSTSGSSFGVTVTLTYEVTIQTANPEVVWAESCPLDKTEEVLQGSICTQEGGNRTVLINGQQYAVYSDCWQYKDVYVSQEADNGTCSEYMNNKACTVNGTTCLESLAGICLSEMATFSCENKVSGTGMMCGGEFFCTDGSCAQGETGTNNMFAKAVSTLAAVAAAGEDIAEFNEANVRAFTGTAQRCRKAMAGFSNCCKDSGWGNDVGLASCSSEEKALGKAKEKKLTVKIGTYCAHKVLGVCVEKKESYCQFDSKLAQIVQDQGRKGQLGIGFGKASSPDCRGITIDELQSINFDTLNFANFYSDLEDGSTIPEDNELLEKAKQMIADKVAEAGK
ncbi:type-F conjugative transfer system mating-pair stabilization protein TraN [Lelliottia nimipressuralis]|uniref:type-F conjugative transfer system mating-pair stabilization protein TraN n=1 Tax=Lelliottia nimipressuralis TaxID=69220 RepID=UPI00289F9625|nr:type-F conjugative transfer system mating-pair stabilization protein TraN [Lelliottia nimipressuralis]